MQSFKRFYGNRKCQSYRLSVVDFWVVIWNDKIVSCCKKIVNFSPFYLWIIGSHTLQATQFSMWMTGTYIQIKEVIAPPWKMYSKTFLGNYRLSHPWLWNEDHIHVLLKKIMHRNMQEFVRKLHLQICIMPRY